MQMHESYVYIKNATNHLKTRDTSHLTSSSSTTTAGQRAFPSINILKSRPLLSSCFCPLLILSSSLETVTEIGEEKHQEFSGNAWVPPWFSINNSCWVSYGGSRKFRKTHVIFLGNFWVFTVLVTLSCIFGREGGIGVDADFFWGKISVLMQGRGGAINSFLDTVNVDQGSAPNNTRMVQHNSSNNMLSPVETRLSNYAVTSGGAMQTNVFTDEVQSFGGWSSGESSSRLSLENPVNDGDIKMECGWSPPPFYGVHSGAGPRSEGRQIQPTNILFPGRVNNGQIGNWVRNGSMYFQGSSSNHIPQNLNLNEGYTGSSASNQPGVAASIGPNLHNSAGLERERTSNAFDNVGSSSGSSNYMVEENSSGSAPLGSWGLSCKRKALEGTSGQAYSDGSSSCSQQVENGVWHAGPARNDTSSSLGLSTHSQVIPPDQLNLRVGFGFGEVTTAAFPSSSVRRTNPGNQQESYPLSLSSAAVSRHSTFTSANQSPRPAPYNGSLDLRSTATVGANSSPPQNQPRAMHISAGNLPPFWAGAFSSPAGSLSINARDRGAGLQEEANIRNVPRNNAENPMLIPESETRNVAQDPTGWTLASGTVTTSEGVPSSTRTGAGSSIHPPHSPWVSLHIPSVHNQQRLSEFSPWSLFPSIDSEAAVHSGNFPQQPVGPSSSSQEMVGSGSSSQGNIPSYSRSASLWERQGDEILGMPHSLQALAVDIEGRHRLVSEIRQVLNAMRRGENLRIEDYMLFDQFLYHGVAEMHDRHRDMRLDVDNMSYEELLALEEQIGDVSTGLSEETILELMKQQKYMSIASQTSQDIEPCCICQEEYVSGDDLGTLDCSHEFHVNCIKQWLMQKNLCPICKTTALLK
ncbi:hypothetical protein SLA2020_210110 [Shorea laevis]